MTPEQRARLSVFATLLVLATLALIVLAGLQIGR